MPQEQGSRAMLTQKQASWPVQTEPRSALEPQTREIVLSHALRSSPGTAPALDHKGSLNVGGDTRISLLSGPDMETDIDLHKIADAVRATAPQAFKSWDGLEAAFAGIQYVAIQVASSSFDIHSDGRFEGHGKLLVKFPHTGLLGEPIMASDSIPASVKGMITPQSVVINDLSYRY